MKAPDGWNPMESAPKDRPILVLHEHDTDPYHLGTGTGPDHLTPYGSYCEGLGAGVEDGPVVAEWSDAETDFDELHGRVIHLPGWWFRTDSEGEAPVSPVGWLPIPGFIRSTADECPGCKSHGFPKSTRKPDRCNFCDNPDEH